MTFDQVIQKWGDIVTFEVNAVIGYSQADKDRINLFFTDVESAILDRINSPVIMSDSIFSGIEVSLKNPVVYSFGNSLKNIVLSYGSDISTIIGRFGSTMGNSDLWIPYLKEGVVLTLDNSHDVKFAQRIYDSPQKVDVWFTASAGMIFTKEFTQVYSGRGYYDTIAKTRIYLTPFKNTLDTVIKYYKVEIHGLKLTNDTPIIETLIHSTPGNYRDLPPESDIRAKAIQDLKDNLQKGVDDKQLSLYEVNSNSVKTTIRTVPIKSTQFSTILKIDSIL